MQLLAFALICLSSVGKGRRIQPQQTLAQSNGLPKSNDPLRALKTILMDVDPKNAFNPSIGRASTSRARGHRCTRPPCAKLMSEPSFVTLAKQCVDNGCTTDDVKAVVADLKAQPPHQDIVKAVDVLEGLLAGQGHSPEENMQQAMKYLAHGLDWSADAPIADPDFAYEKAYNKMLAYTDATLMEPPEELTKPIATLDAAMADQTMPEEEKIKVIRESSNILDDFIVPEPQPDYSWPTFVLEERDRLLFGEELAENSPSLNMYPADYFETIPSLSKHPENLSKELAENTAKYILGVYSDDQLRKSIEKIAERERPKAEVVAA